MTASPYDQAIKGARSQGDLMQSLQKRPTLALDERALKIGNSSLEQLLHNEAAALKPFVHQVTGRSHMLSLDNATICKSLLLRELLFYANIPDDLRPYVPELKGILYARLEESDVKGEHKFSTDRLFVKSNPTYWNKSDGFCQRQSSELALREDGFSRQADAYKEILFKGLERFKYDMTSGFTSHPWTVDKDAEAITEFIGANPWAVRQHRREINRMLSLDGASPDRKPLNTDAWQHILGRAATNLVDSKNFLRGYLMLEDVTEGFTHPNVIDFKLGRQIERDDCSQEKKNKHVELAKNSSTGTLMLRLAGMQVYQVNSGHYLCRDKYYGRGLSSSGFKESIKQFLNNGVRTLAEVVPPITHKLRSLLSVLEKQNSFRFYASSLLILYEGDDLRPDCGANSVESHHPVDSSVSKSNASRGVQHGEFGRKIDVRMIDFAHSTYEGFNGDRSSHEGPDLDCLHALSNLITILEDIKSGCNTDTS